MRHEPEHQDDGDIEELLRAVRPDTTPRPGFQEELLVRLLGDEGTHKASTATKEVAAWRQVISRHSRSVSRIAAGVAAMFVVAVAVWWFLGGNVGVASAQFADVLSRIRQANTVTFNAKCLSSGGAKVRTHVAISYPGRVRTTMADGKVLIIDMSAGKRLNLMPLENRAVLFSNSSGSTYAEPLNDLRQAVASQGRLIGSETVKGLRTEVYQVVLTGSTLRVWVDPKESFPVRIESRTTQADGQESLMTLDNFSWNVQVSDSLFSMTPPAGYALIDMEAAASEQSLIDLLKICSQDADGCFPDSLDAIAVLNVIAKRYPGECQVRTEDAGAASSSITISGKAQEDHKACIRGLNFIKRVDGTGKWRYAGQGVKLGDKTAVVCWWQLPGNTSFRVVYGDLTVKDMAAEELPVNEK